MLTKQDIIDKALELGFDDIGFTNAEVFNEHKPFLQKTPNNYTWAAASGLQLEEGCNPVTILPQAKSIVVLLQNYYKYDFPKSMEPFFGRCYMDDDRVTRDGLTIKIKQFIAFLRDDGIKTKTPFHLPQKAAAARAGIGTFGKNCLLYANNTARKSSWINPVTIVIDKEYEPGKPTVAIGCPDWCRNACIAACPTRALKGNCTIDSQRCISYLTYYASDITPYELREPMGLSVYGCDRCQDVCPRNKAWMSQVLPINERVVTKAPYFDLVKLLHMDEKYFLHYIWAHMFYTPATDMWRWKMNVARAMGNSSDDRFVPELIAAFNNNNDPRVQGMIAWALGTIGGVRAKDALHGFRAGASDAVLHEIERALDSLHYY